MSSRRVKENNTVPPSTTSFVNDIIAKEDERLRKLERHGKLNLTNHENDEGEEQSESPIMRRFIIENGADKFISLTNFTVQEFENLWVIIGDKLLSEWNGGPGARSNTTAKDLFFIFVMQLKQYMDWDALSALVSIPGPTLARQFKRTLELVHDSTCCNLIPSIKNVRQNKGPVMFKNFPSAMYTNDARVQECQKPQGRFSEAKRYYSGKHSLYCLKTEASILPDGICAHVSNHVPGATADIELMQKNLIWHIRALKKTKEDSSVTEDVEEGVNEFPESWPCILDKGYVGIDHHGIRAIIPKKNQGISS